MSGAIESERSSAVSLAEEAYELAMQTCTTQQRETLKLIKQSCDRIAKVKGRISQVNVAREIESVTKRKIYQTIRNNKLYSRYIKLRELEAVSGTLPGGRESPTGISSDPVAMSQIEVLQIQLENARKYIQRLEAGIKELQPLTNKSLSSFLKALDKENRSGPPETLSLPPAIITQTVSAKVKDAFVKLLDPGFLSRFQLRLEDGEIVNKLELTLIDRAAVAFLAKLTSGSTPRDD